MTATLTSSNAAAIARGLRQAPPQVREAFRQLVARTMREVASDVRAGYRSGRPKVVSGNLVRGVEAEIRKDSDGLAAVVMSAAPHAWFVEFGSEGIRRGQRGASRYRGRAFGRMPAQPVVAPTRTRHRAAFQSAALRVLERALAEIAS